MKLRVYSEGILEIEAPAKVNLHLEITGKRSDGYHDIDTVMMGLSLVDRLRFRRRDDSQIAIQVFTPRNTCLDSAWRVPTDSRNLVVKALDLFRNKQGHSQGMDVWIWKGIPAEAGLGGGSSDAAAALVAASILWEKAFDQECVCRCAAELGSDINFFIEALVNRFNIACCTGRGEIVQPLDLAGPLSLIVAQPPEGCSTRSVFQRLGEIGEKTPNTKLLDSLSTGNVSQLGTLLYNRLEEAACLESSWIRRMKLEFNGENLLGHAMSGSGASRFGLCKNSSIAANIAKRLQGRLPVMAFHGTSWNVPPLRTQLKSIGIGT